MTEERDLWDAVRALSLADYRRFGLACCHRLEYLLKDVRLRRALRKFEKFVETQSDTQILIDAYNTVNSVYAEIRGNSPLMCAEAAAACTLLCALDQPAPNLIGNFESALLSAEGLKQEQTRKMGFDLLEEIHGK